MPTRRTPEDFTAEVEAHLRIEIDRLIAEGMSPRDARAAAVRSFGSPTRAREQFYERSRWMWLDQFAQDLRYAWRGLRASPAFLTTTVVTLAVGLGLLTTAFTVFNAYVLRPFAVADPSRLYRIAWRTPDAVGHSMSSGPYEELRARTDLFDAVIADDMRFVSRDGRAFVVSLVTDNYFDALRPRMLLGRPLDERDAGQDVAVIGQQAWTRLFGGDRAAVGRTLNLDTRAVTVVGVLREEFGGLDAFPRDVWVLADPGSPRSMEVIVRLRADVSPIQAEVRLQEFAARLAPEAAPRAVRAVLVPAGTPNPLSIELVAALSPVFAAFALVLLAGCFNVSNVMLARAIARHREIAVRLSLGASRGRIVRQLLTEGALIAAVAGACALALAAWLLRAAIVAVFGTLPPTVASLIRVAPMAFDWRVFAFAFAAGGATTLLFALLPAMQASRQPLTDALRGLRSGRAAGSRMRDALVVAQVAVSILLVVTAVVLARNFTALATLDLGYSTRNVYSITVRDRQHQLIRPAAEALALDPRIASVAITSGNPLFQTRTAQAAPFSGGAVIATMYTFVSPEFFSILKMPIVRGRTFRPEEARSAASVAIVSEATARAFWPGSDPVGQVIRIDRRPEGRADDAIEGYPEITVVGTVPDVVSGLMFEGTDPGHIYLPASAADARATAMLIAPRAAGDFRPDMLRETFRRLGDPDTFETVPLEDMRQMQMYPMRAAAWVGTLLGGIALVLSVVGLYGVLSYTLAQRTREIGIRMALGATASAVVRLVMRQSARMAAIGAAIGVCIAFAALKTLASVVVRLREIRLLDPVSFGAAVIIVAAAAALAAYQPSRRATRVDPAETLRAEG